jgi:hypothetical protein
MSDAVVVTMIPGSTQTSVHLWVVPAFARRGLCYDDVDILNALRVMLTIKVVLYNAIELPYKRMKRLEASGASCYVALPAYPPSFWGHNARPCVLYTLLAAGRMRTWLEDVLTLPQLFRLMWNVIVPERCPRCDDADFWALESEHTALCYGCSFTLDV